MRWRHLHAENGSVPCRYGAQRGAGGAERKLMANLTFAPATELARAIREREVSATEVVEAHLARIAAVNPRINAVVQLPAERARAEARTADAALARGESAGPLHGVPFSVKDT